LHEHLGKSVRSLKDNIKIGLKEIGFKDLDRIELVPDRIQ